MSWLNKFGHVLIGIGKEVQVIGPVVGPFIPIPGVAAGIAIATKISSSIQNAAQQVNTPGSDKMALAIKSTQDAFSVAKSIAAAEGKSLPSSDTRTTRVSYADFAFALVPEAVCSAKEM